MCVADAKGLSHTIAFPTCTLYMVGWPEKHHNEPFILSTETYVMVAALRRISVESGGTCLRERRTAKEREQLQQLSLDGVRDSLKPVVRVQFPIDVMQVIPQSLKRDTQFTGNLS
jgi:hypothetical protein